MSHTITRTIRQIYARFARNLQTDDLIAARLFGGRPHSALTCAWDYLVYVESMGARILERCRAFSNPNRERSKKDML